MFKKTFCIFLIFLSSCGYNAIHTNKGVKNINIDVIKTTGNIDINNIFIRNLDRYKNLNAEKNYKIEIITNYNKKTLTKNIAGNTTDYRLNLNVIFKILTKDSSNQINLTKRFDMKKENTTFQEEQYENILIDDMVKLIIQELLIQL